MRAQLITESSRRQITLAAVYRNQRNVEECPSSVHSIEIIIITRPRALLAKRRLYVHACVYANCVYRVTDRRSTADVGEASPARFGALALAGKLERVPTFLVRDGESMKSKTRK